MGNIVVQAFMTLDGVVQGPGGPDEDQEGGFEYGGWQGREVIGNTIADWESKTEALMLGRKTYDIFSRSWGVWDENAAGFEGELTRRYNRIPKYVASHSLSELAWMNSRLLDSDLAAEAKQLRRDIDGEIRIWGSTQLVKSLAQHHQIDEYRLVVYPLVLGDGKRLFSAGFPLTTLNLVESTSYDAGVLVNIYRPSESEAG